MVWKGNNMILGTICARAGSKGVPGKNLKAIDCVPLIGYTFSQALSYKEFDKVVVSTDGKDIAGLAKHWGINDVQMRPPELATDTASKWDVFRHIAKECGLAPDDILVDLDITCPLREPQDITACVERLRGGNFDVVCTAYESEKNPYFNMVETMGDVAFVPCRDLRPGKLKPPITRRQDAPKVYSISPSVFAIRVSALEKYDHWSQSKLGIVEIPRLRGLDIDTQDDWDIVEFLMSRKAQNEK